MLEVGAGFAGYQVEGVLGQGGMGTVYLAKHPRLPRSVALKLLNREFSADQELQRRFEREADVVAQLEHPGIVGVFDRGSDDGYLWIAMQFIRGTDAAVWDSRAYQPAVTARLIGETASALDFANQRGVLHRDVKPGNILIADPDRGLEQRAVLTDFGIARVATANTQLTATGTFTATLAYASPEQLSGEIVDHYSDQYSLACTLFAMYAGHPPFTATNPGQVVAGHLSQPVPRLTSVRSDLPVALDGVLARAMAKRRDERFASSTEFAEAVQGALEGRHVSAPTVRQPWSAQAAPVAPQALVPPQAPMYRPAAPEPGWPQPGSAVPVADPRLAPAAFAQPWQPPRAPSKVTATIAGIGALVVGLVLLSVALFATYLTLQADRDGLSTEGNALGIALIYGAGAFGFGAGLLMLRGTRAGRIMTFVIMIPGELYALMAIAAALIEQIYLGAVAMVVVSVLGGLVIGCAAAPSTGRWIRHRRSATAVTG
ncbi:serine/threonine-protein kinase [Nocardia sp. NPDC059177]|uniref:serine/threonine-protein kinase n=1 Tax=Nocardia sp. NPDC059177 TaxID=3346759 RepID=UPI0036941C14